MPFKPISTRLVFETETRTAYIYYLLWNRNTNNVHLLRVEAGVNISDME